MPSPEPLVPRKGRQESAFIGHERSSGSNGKRGSIMVYDLELVRRAAAPLDEGAIAAAARRRTSAAAERAQPPIRRPGFRRASVAMLLVVVTVGVSVWGVAVRTRSETVRVAASGAGSSSPTSTVSPTSAPTVAAFIDRVRQSSLPPSSDYRVVIWEETVPQVHVLKDGGAVAVMVTHRRTSALDASGRGRIDLAEQRSSFLDPEDDERFNDGALHVNPGVEAVSVTEAAPTAELIDRLGQARTSDRPDPSVSLDLLTEVVESRKTSPTQRAEALASAISTAGVDSIVTADGDLRLTSASKATGLRMRTVVTIDVEGQLIERSAVLLEAAPFTSASAPVAIEQRRRVSVSWASTPTS